MRSQGITSGPWNKGSLAFLQLQPVSTFGSTKVRLRLRLSSRRWDPFPIYVGRFRRSVRISRKDALRAGRVIATCVSPFQRTVSLHFPSTGMCVGQPCEATVA